MTELPQGWVETTINEVSSYVTSGSRDWSKYYSQTGSLFIRTQDINKNKLCALPEIARVSLPDKVEGKRTLVHKGDLLITITGANVGKCAEVKDHLPEAYVSQSVALVRLAHDELSAFLQRQLMTPAGDTGSTELEKRAYGLGRPVLSLEDVREVPVRLAPLPEQRRIVAKIDSLTGKSRRARDHLDHMPRLVEKYKQAVLAAAFRGELTSSGNGLRPRMAWAKGKLSDVCDHRRPITYGVIKLGSEVQGGVPCLRTSNVRWLYIDVSGIKSISPILSDEYHRTILSGGEVLVNVRGTLGGVAVVPPSMAGWNVSREVAVAPIDNERVHASYAAYWIASRSSQNWLTRMEKGVAYTGINIEDLRKLPIEYPDPETQVLIVSRIESAFTWIERLASEATSARKLIDHLDQAVLAKAFRGELVPQDPNDEPASMLIERIKVARSAIPKTKHGRK